MGLRSMKAATGPAASIMSTVETMTAATITFTSLAMPIAVMMLSSEKTMLMRPISRTTLQNRPDSFCPLAGAFESDAGPSISSWISVAPL